MPIRNKLHLFLTLSISFLLSSCEIPSTFFYYANVFDRYQFKGVQCMNSDQLKVVYETDTNPFDTINYSLDYLYVLQSEYYDDGTAYFRQVGRPSGGRYEVYFIIPSPPVDTHAVFITWGTELDNALEFISWPDWKGVLHPCDSLIEDVEPTEAPYIPPVIPLIRDAPEIINSTCVGSGDFKQLMIVFEFEQEVLSRYAAFVADSPYELAPVVTYPNRLYYFGPPPPQGPIPIRLVSLVDSAIVYDDTYVPVVCGPREKKEDNEGGYSPPAY